MSPGWRTYPKAKNHLVNTGGARWGPPTFRLPVAQTRLPQARAAGGWRRGSVGEHRGLGRGQWDEIIYRVVLFTKLLERAPLSGGWGELESRFGPSGRCRGGSLVNASRLRGRVAARPLPQAAQCFALVRRRGGGRRCWLSHRSLRRGESASPDSSLMQTCSLVCFWVSPVPRTGLKLAVPRGSGIGGRQVTDRTSGVLNVLTNRRLRASPERACP